MVERAHRGSEGQDADSRKAETDPPFTFHKHNGLRCECGSTLIGPPLNTIKAVLGGRNVTGNICQQPLTRPARSQRYRCGRHPRTLFKQPTAVQSTLAPAPFSWSQHRYGERELLMCVAFRLEDRLLWDASVVHRGWGAPRSRRGSSGR